MCHFHRKYQNRIYYTNCWDWKVPSSQQSDKQHIINFLWRRRIINSMLIVNFPRSSGRTRKIISGWRRFESLCQFLINICNFVLHLHALLRRIFFFKIQSTTRSPGVWSHCAKLKTKKNLEMPKLLGSW